MNYNRVTIGGHLTRDPELKHLDSGAVCGLGIAVNERWTDKAGQKQERVSFIDADAFGKTAENIAQFFTKGRAILIDGRLRMDTWEQDGQKRSKLKVVVDQFYFVDKKDEATTEAAIRRTEPKSPARMPRPATSPISNHEPVKEEDVPF